MAVLNDVRHGTHPAIVGLMLLAAGVSSAGARRQDVSEPALKAAFLFNFAKFTEWPAAALPAGAPIRICVTDDAVADALGGTVAGKTIDSHPLALARVTAPRSPADEVLRTCALAYVTGLDARGAEATVASVQAAPVFTVSDYENFAALGGVANFLIEGNRMRFAINPAAAERAGLHLSSQLLAVARVVKDRAR